MRIRVCDDIEDIADNWVAAVKAVVPADYDVARMPDAKEEISKLLTRKLLVEKGDNPVEQDIEFDSIDVLIVDYDLLHLDELGGRTTGEGVARLARSFSKCGAIVVMNQFQGPHFDLGMRGHLDSFADVNIDATLVGKKALWDDIDIVSGDFDPTTWTAVPSLLVAARGLRQTLMDSGFDAPILPQIGLDPSAIAELSDTAFGFLSLDAQSAEDLASLTVRDFIGRSLEETFANCLVERAPELAFNFTAFRVVKWLDRAVLRPMNVLIDAPHLVDRLPFLIDPQKADLANANDWTRAAAQPEQHLQWGQVEKYHNKLASRALGKPVFDWYRIADDDEIDALQDAFLEKQAVRFFLAENTSRFVEKDALIRFRAEFHNFGDRRAIEKLDDITYGPLRRIHFG